MSVDFSDPGAARLDQKVQGQDIPWTIGLDGHPRITADGDALRGYWKDQQTFHMEDFDIGTQAYEVTFEGATAQITVEGGDVSISCRITAP